MKKEEVLKNYFGYDSFREGQEVLINSILDLKDTFGIMPTGAGKSLCYQVPAIMLEGITLVISPLISLMKDQVQALNIAGVRAAYLNSTLTPNQYVKALEEARRGTYKIIYVAPERLLLDNFINFCKSVNISMITIDEVHCVSQWGQDFRPSYLKIIDFIKKLDKRPIISCFTATATCEVEEDVIKVLDLVEPNVIVTGFDRKNLFYSVLKPVDKLKKVTQLVRDYGAVSGIIYCSTRKSVDEVYKRLHELKYKVTKYHAGLTKAERDKNQEDFIYDKKPIIVATNAFGMGIDKSNVRYVIHYNMPKDIESYYQEAGRAGRDGLESDCILMYGAKDVSTNEWFIMHNENKELTIEERLAIKERDEDRLKKMIGYCFTNECLRDYILRYFGEYSSNFCNKCSNCTANFESVDVTEYSKKILMCIKSTHERFGRVVITDILHGSKNARIKESNLNENDYYGSLKDISMVELRQIIQHLMVGEYIYQESGEYPVLKLGEKSLDILNGKQQVSMKMIKEDKSKIIVTTIEDYDLYELLKKKRLEIAKSEHMPPYIIFSDKTLREMCKYKPATKNAFLNISGVGEVKYEKYGEEFIKVIWNYVKSKLSTK